MHSLDRRISRFAGPCWTLLAVVLGGGLLPSPARADPIQLDCTIVDLSTGQRTQRLITIDPDRNTVDELGATYSNGVNTRRGIDREEFVRIDPRAAEWGSVNQVDRTEIIKRHLDRETGRFTLTTRRFGPISEGTCQHTGPAV